MTLRVLTQRIAFWWRTLRLLADWRSRAALVWAKAAHKLSRGRGGPPDAISITVAAPEPHVLWIRPAATDASLVDGYLGSGQNLPEDEIAGEELTQICEFGTNVGIGLADLALRYPRARLLGVEPDPANAAVARRNLEPFADRCTLVEAAVWGDDGELELVGEVTSQISAQPAEAVGRAGETVRGVRPETLLKRHLPEGMIDYLHLDMVGSEPRILGPESVWVERVRSVKIQLYPDRGFGAQQCLQLLRKLGFEARLLRARNGDCYAFGVRTATLA